MSKTPASLRWATRPVSRLFTFACLSVFVIFANVPLSAQAPDLTAGGAPNNTAYINLGPTGMQGWIYNDGPGNLNETISARQILVTKVAADSPADGVLAVDDVILGADGTGADPVIFTSDARKALAYAIDDAEGNSPAVLKLLRWRSGVTTTVSITLENLGSYTATAPYNCPKSAAILEKGLDYIMTSEPGSGYGGFGTTVLLAANDPNNPANAARQARAQAEAHELILTQQQIDDMTSGDLKRSIGKPWSIGPQLIAQAEYYLQTGDAAVLPSIRARAIQIANAQSLFGTMGHHYSLPGAGGSVNGPYGIGYGPVNNAGMPCFLGLILAGKCGLTDPAILDGIGRAAKYFQYYADLGTVPYGENKETGSISNNGKSALAAVTLSMVDGYETQAKYFTKLSVFGARERDSGHTGPYFNHLWTPLGSNLGGQDAMAHYFSATSWLYDLGRGWDGSFVYQPYYQSGGIKTYGQGHRASWTTLLTYAAPLAKLHITGRNANPALVLDATDIADINHAIGYNAATRTTPELIEDLKSPLPQLHWSAGNEIGANRSADHASIIPTLIDMANNGATYAEKHGAIYALGKIADDSTAADLSALLFSPNSKVRYMVGNALSNLSMAAKTAQAATIVNALVATDRPLLPLDPENPMHVEKQTIARLLFDSGVGIWGGSRVAGADRALLYPAFRIIATAPMGGTRDTAFSVASYLTKEDVENLADVMVHVATNPPPGEITYGNRTGAITAMQVNDFAEGVPASVIVFEDSTKNKENALAMLEAYAGSSLTVVPDPRIVDFCENLLTNSDSFDAEAQAVLDAIANDPLPAVLTPFKSINWVFADNPNLTLPERHTVLRLQSTDFAKGTPSYTWRKVHGAGEVTFTPNGTGAARDTTVVFDGTPGVYTFEVTMSDTRGLTETSKTVTVNLYDTGGTLPSNTAPTANSQSITVGQGTPTQVVLTGSDPEGLGLIYSVTHAPSHGHLSGTAPYLVYTANANFTGPDSLTFEVMDSEGAVASATVSITVEAVSGVGVGVYEPFDYPKGFLNGTASTAEVGLDGSWNADGSINVIGGSLPYGTLSTAGGSIGNLASAGTFGGARAINPAALAGNGLLNDGATLWFSAVVGHPGNNYNQQLYLALANNRFGTSNNFYILNEGAQLGSGVGLTVNGGQAQATQFQDGSQGGITTGHVYGTWDASIAGSVGTYGHRLAVGKITWGATSDTIEIYLPKEDMILPSTPSSVLTVSVDQTTFDTLTFSRNGTPLLDEIRFGSTYQSVLQGTATMTADVTAPTPDPMTFAVAPAPSGPSSITMTATPAHDVMEVEYYFACTAGGGSDSGWQNGNVYTDSGLTAGTQYSYTVKARDKQPGLNETVASAAASATIPTSATVPDVVGVLQASAEDLVVAADLTVGTITQATAYSLTVPEGHVLSQSPTGASTATYGSAVNLEISIGQNPALPTLAAIDIVDDQAGGPVVVNTLMTYTLTFSEDMDAATVDAADFVNAGDVPITVGAITETSPGVFTVQVTPTGTGILRFAVAAGASLLDAQGDALNTTLAIIDDTVVTVNLPDEIVPDVLGLAQATAEANIVAANLVVGTIRWIYDEVVPAGNVHSQDPVGGSILPGQYPVNLVISQGPPPDTTGPVIAATDPADGGYNVEANANLTVIFDENVFVSSGSIVIRNLNDGSDMLVPVTDTAQVSTYLNVLTIDPAENLVAGNSYAVRIAAGAVVDASGNGFAGINDNTTWNFSTSSTQLETTLFSEDFEAPDVAAYSEGTTPASWVRANQGFGATRHGLTDKAGGDFSAPDPNHQAYAFRYGNSGITTAEGTIGTITQGMTYEVSFDVVRDNGLNAGTPYNVKLLAYDPGAARNDCRSSSPGIELAAITGNARSDGLFSTVSFQHTVPAGSSAIGMDLAVRFIGASTSAIVDNVVVKVVSNPNDPDQVPPAIASLTPADNATSVSLTDNLKVEFDEAVAVASGFITLVNLTNTSETKINIVDSLRVFISGSSLEINPTADLDTNTAYAVRIDPGAIVDLAGNGFPGITDSTTWSFNTGEVDDSTAPTVVALSPADGSTGVSYRTTLSLTFDENVVASTGYITLKNLTDATSALIDVSDSSQVTVFGTEVTLTPAAYLGEGKNYAVRIDAGAFFDLADNPYAGIADDVTWNFTTAMNNPPAIAALDPLDGAVGVDPGANLSVTFDENIMVGTGNITLRNTSDLVDTVIDVTDAGQVSVSGQMMTINPVGNLAQGKVFAVLMDAGAVIDLDGNAFGGISSEATWDFASGVSSDGAVFVEDFEVASGSPDVDALGSTGDTSKKTGPKWVRATNGFGADRHGIVDESSGQFVDPNGEQAYAFRYTNSGITTVVGGIGALTSGATYSVSFYVVRDGLNSGNSYKAELVTFGAGALRNDIDANQSRLLASTTGSYNGTSYQLVTFEYTSDGVNDLAVQGHDVALRFVGASTSANIDNIQVAVNGGGGGGDTTPPTLASTDIVDDQAGAPVTANALVTYTVTFSEDMDETTVDATDFGNAGTSAMTIGTVTETSPGVFAVQATPTTDGTLQLQVNAGAVLTDLAGNALDTTSAIADSTVITVESGGGGGNSAPVWASDPVLEANATQDTAYSSTLADDASDIDGDTLSYAKVSGPAWLNVALDGALTGTPGNADVGTNNFIVSVSDGITAPVETTLVIEVLNVNDAPVASDGSISTDEDTAVAITLIASDLDGDALTYNVVTQPINGTLSGTAPSLTYTPNANYGGSDSFTFVANDGLTDSNTATVSITVVPSNPQAEPGGPYRLLVTDSLALDGSASLPSNGEILTTYEWDLNNDNSFGDVAGTTPTAIPATDLMTAWAMVPGLNTIQLKVADSADKTSVATTTVELVSGLTWDANGATAGQTNGGGAWLGTNQWWDGIANIDWSPGLDANFGVAETSGGTVTLASPISVGTITFNTFAGTYTLGSTGQAITISGDVINQSASGAVTIISPVVLGSAQTWENNSTAFMTIGSASTSNNIDNGGFTITADGTGRTRVWGSISGSGGIIKNGPGVLDLGGQSQPSGLAHSYAGITTVNEGTVQVHSAANLGTGNLIIQGGTLQHYYQGTFTRSLGQGDNQVQLPGGTSGFGIAGSAGTIRINNDANFELVWGSAYFNPDAFLLQGVTTNANANLTLSNKIDLNGATRTIRVDQPGGDLTNGYARIAGIIRNSSGSAGIIKTGSGQLILNANNTYNGETTVMAGNLRLNFTNTNNGASTVTISPDATLQLAFTGTDTVDRLFIGDAQMAAGVYKAIGSAAIGTGLAQITGTGTLMVTSGPVFGAVDSFVISGVPAQATDGTAITGITVTALEANGETATGFIGTVSFGGTAGITGTSASFVDGVLQNVSITPLNIGNDLTFTVDDGNGHGGSGTFNVVSVPYGDWVTANNLSGEDAASNSILETDGLTNIQKFAFGMDPNISFSGAIEFSGNGLTTPGMPVAHLHAITGTSVDYRVVFGRRKDHLAAGLVYTVQFSAGMDAWVTSGAAPEMMADGGDAEVDVVHIPYPLIIQTSSGFKKPRFFRVDVQFSTD